MLLLPWLGSSFVSPSFEPIPGDNFLGITRDVIDSVRTFDEQKVFTTRPNGDGEWTTGQSSQFGEFVEVGSGDCMRFFC
jgi:hypothetical protein